MKFPPPVCGTFLRYFAAKVLDLYNVSFKVTESIFKVWENYFQSGLWLSIWMYCIYRAYILFGFKVIVVKLLCDDSHQHHYCNLPSEMRFVMLFHMARCVRRRANASRELKAYLEVQTGAL